MKPFANSVLWLTLAVPIAVAVSDAAAPAPSDAGLAATVSPQLDRRTVWLDDGAAAKSAAPAVADERAAINAARRALERRYGPRAAAEIATAKMVSTSARGSWARIVRFGQTVAGIEVFGARINVLLDGELDARALTGGFSPNTHSAAPAGFRLTAGDAIEAAVTAVAGRAPGQVAELPADGADGFVRFAIDGAGPFAAGGPVRAKPVWYPAADRLLPAYRVELRGSRAGIARPLARSLIVSAEDGRVLRSKNLIHDLRPAARPAPCVRGCAAAPYRYRVPADRSGQPYPDPHGYTNPHPTGLRDGSLPTQAAPLRLIARAHGDIATRDPWLPDDATHTVGNNVDAYFRTVPVVDGVYGFDDFLDGWSFRPEAGDFRAPLTGPRAFDHAYELALAPEDYFQRAGAPVAPVPVDSPQLNAKIVQAFYAGNWLHDLFYDLGYDEAAGNAQHDNYGRGGLDGDPLIAIAGYHTTFAFAPDDGESPAVVMGLNVYSLSNRDATFDVTVFGHEWAHTMFGRLTEMDYQGQPGALNEGTADFVGMLLSVRFGDRDAPPADAPFHGGYAVGAYVNLDYEFPGDGLPPAGSPGYPDNSYYHGIRRFPYSASFVLNPLSFKYVSPEHPLPAGWNPFDWKRRSLRNYEIHTAGEIWASALWQCARNLLAEASSAREFEAGKRRFLAHLVAGLKLFPTDATYTEARDAVLLAIRASDEDEYRACRAGFAARGLGAGAVAPARDSIEMTGVIESFVDADPF